MRRILWVLVQLFYIPALLAQVPKAIVVEHFTNTLCSVCANRNPGFYSNLANQPEVMHLAVHPSAPYKNCVLNKHNTLENDARTNYYGVYGSTPRLVINGVPLANSADYSSSAIFDAYKGLTSPVSMRVEQKKYGSDSISVAVIVKNVESMSAGNHRIFIAIAEDTLDYNAPNGEDSHYDVFRESLTGAEGTAIALPVNAGDSVVVTASTSINPEWDPSSVYVFAMVQDEASKELVQAARSLASEGIITSVNEHKCQQKPHIFPNPASQTVNIRYKSLQGDYSINIVDLQGRQIYIEQGIGQGAINTRIDVGSLKAGLYFIEINCEGKTSREKLIIR